MEFLTVVCRVAVAAAFLLAAGGKVVRGSRFEAFASSVRSVTDLPAGAVRPVAAVVVAAEVAVAGLLLAADAAAPICFVVAAALLVLFSAALLRLRHRGGACNCFGGGRPVDGRQLVRNAGLLSCCATGLMTAELSRGVPGDGPDLVLAVLTGLAVTAGLLWLTDRPPAVAARPGS